MYVLHVSLYFFFLLVSDFTFAPAFFFDDKDNDEDDEDDDEDDERSRPAANSSSTDLRVKLKGHGPITDLRGLPFFAHFLQHFPCSTSNTCNENLKLFNGN